MTPKERKIIFLQKLKKLMNDDISTYNVSTEHYLFIDNNKYQWRIDINPFIITIEFKYKNSFLNYITFYESFFTVFNLPFYIKLIKFYIKAKKYGLQKTYEKSFEELLDDLKEDLKIINRSKKIKKVYKK